MSKNLYQLMSAVKVIDVVVTVMLLIAIIAVLIKQRDNIREMLENWRKKRNFEDSAINMINANAALTHDNTKKIEELEQSMLNARETSRDIRKEIYNDLKEISIDVKELIKVVNTMQEKEEFSKRAIVKEKIEKIYRECGEVKMCTDMQFETLKDLIEDYERRGGDNSFVHSVVLKEMYTWDIIKKIPDIEQKG